MNNLKQLQEEIEPLLQELEQFRLKQMHQAQQIPIYYVVPALLTVVAIPIYWKVNPVMGFVVFGIAVAVAVQMVTYKKPTQDYLGTIKGKLFTSIAQKFLPTVQYKYGQCISPQALLDSELFSHIPTTYEGEDYFEGLSSEGHAFQCSKVTAAKGAKVLLDGWFFEIEMPINFQSKVIVMPSKGKRSPKKVQDLGQLSLQGLTAEGELVTVANVYPTFEKNFTVYSHSREMAYYILVPSIIQAIHQMHQRWKVKPQISFINNKVYVAIKNKKEVLFPTIHRSLVEEKKLMKGVLEELMRVFEVVNGLSLASKNQGLPPVEEEEEPKEEEPIENDDFPIDLDEA